MKYRIAHLFIAACAALAGGSLLANPEPRKLAPSAQETADSHNRTMQESLAHHKEDAATVAKLLGAIGSSDVRQFFSDGDPSFTAMKESAFVKISKQIGEALKAGHEFTLAAYLRRDGSRVSVWAISFDDGRDDLLATLSIKDGKVAGFSLN